MDCSEVQLQSSDLELQTSAYGRSWRRERGLVSRGVHGDALMQDPETGVYRTIREAYETKGLLRVYTWSRAEGVHVRDVEVRPVSDLRHCLKLTLWSGREVIVTPERMFRTPAHGWLRADELREEFNVLVAGRTQFPEKPVIGPGEPLGKGMQRMPERTFRLGKVALVKVLREVWEAEGTYDEEGRPVLEAESRGLVEDWQRLFLRLGIRTQVLRYEEKPWYRLRVSSESLISFAEQIVEDADQRADLIEVGANGDPDFRLYVSQRILQDATMGYQDALFMGQNEGLWKLVREGFELDSVFDLYGEKEDPEVFLSLPGFERLCGVLNGKNLLRPMTLEQVYGWIYRADVAWDRVGKIGAVGEQQVYDLVVESTNCLLVDDAVMHSGLKVGPRFEQLGEVDALFPI